MRSVQFSRSRTGSMYGLVGKNTSAHAEHVERDQHLEEVDAAHVQLELVLEAASFEAVEALYRVLMLEVVVVYGFVLVPWSASDCESVAAYPSPPEFAQDGRRVRPSSQTSRGTVRPAASTYRRICGVAAGCWAAPAGSAAASASPGARLARPARPKVRSLARSLGSGRPGARRSLGIPRALRAASFGALRCRYKRSQGRADTLPGLPKPSPGVPGRGRGAAGGRCARMLELRPHSLRRPQAAAPRPPG